MSAVSDLDTCAKEREVLRADLERKIQVIADADDEIKTLYANLRALALAAKAFYGSYAIEPKMQVKADALGEALAREGVQEALRDHTTDRTPAS